MRVMRVFENSQCRLVHTCDSEKEAIAATPSTSLEIHQKMRANTQKLSFLPGVRNHESVSRQIESYIVSHGSTTTISTIGKHP
jgi:hypothetical protein